MVTNFFLRGFKERGRRAENKDQADPDHLHSRAAGVPGGGFQEVPVHGGPGQALRNPCRCWEAFGYAVLGNSVLQDMWRDNMQGCNVRQPNICYVSLFMAQFNLRCKRCRVDWRSDICLYTVNEFRVRISYHQSEYGSWKSQPYFWRG